MCTLIVIETKPTCVLSKHGVCADAIIKNMSLEGSE